MIFIVKNENYNIKTYWLCSNGDKCIVILYCGGALQYIKLFNFKIQPTDRFFFLRTYKIGRYNIIIILYFSANNKNNNIVLYFFVSCRANNSKCIMLHLLFLSPFWTLWSLWSISTYTTQSTVVVRTPNDDYDDNHVLINNDIMCT